jgi:rubredoxin
MTTLGYKYTKQQRENCSIAAKKRWERPEEHRKMSEGIKAAMARPEVREKYRINATTHGYSKHPLYGVRHNMIQRCCKPNSISYKNYGARGITICPEWLDGPEAFIEWGMKNGYKRGLWIERINYDSSYSPENCKFVTPTENLNNRRPISEKGKENCKIAANKRWENPEEHKKRSISAKACAEKSWITRRKRTNPEKLINIYS